MEKIDAHGSYYLELPFFWIEGDVKKADAHPSYCLGFAFAFALREIWERIGLFIVLLCFCSNKITDWWVDSDWR